MEHEKQNFSTYLSQDLRYIYVITFAFLIYGTYKQRKISWEEIYRVTRIHIIIVASVSVISKLMNIGIDYAGTKRLFIEVNALTAILVFGISITLYDLFLSKFNIKSLSIVALLVYAAFSQATKTSLIGVIVCFSYFLFFLFYMGAVKKRHAKVCFLTIIGIVGISIIYYYFYSSAGIDVRRRWQYFYSRLDFVSFMLSGRNSLFEISFDIWKENIIFILFGISFSNAKMLFQSKNIKVSYIGAEMDFFDVGFYYGIFAMTAIACPILRRFVYALMSMKRKQKESYFNFAYMLFCAMALLGGHVLSSPMAGIIFWASYIMTMEETYE